MAELLERLRSATRPLHDQLDGAALSGRITDGTLDLPAYRRLVDWQLHAHLTAEPGLHDFAWPASYTYRARTLVLTEEAVLLGLELPVVHEALRPPASLAVAVGRAYVLEGSSLGGNMILGHLQRNPQLRGVQHFGFYEFQRANGVVQWRHFLAFAKTLTFAEAEAAACVTAAREVFEVFAKAQPRDA